MQVTIKLPQKVILECDGTVVRIKHKGAFAFVNRTSGEKTIPLSRIQAIDFRPGSIASNGHIQFIVAGHIPVKQNMISSKSDDYTILFYPYYTNEIREFKEYVEGFLYA